MCLPTNDVFMPHLSLQRAHCFGLMNGHLDPFASPQPVAERTQVESHHSGAHSPFSSCIVQEVNLVVQTSMLPPNACRWSDCGWNGHTPRVPRATICLDSKPRPPPGHSSRNWMQIALQSTKQTPKTLHKFGNGRFELSSASIWAHHLSWWWVKRFSHQPAVIYNPVTTELFGDTSCGGLQHFLLDSIPCASKHQPCNSLIQTIW